MKLLLAVGESSHGWRHAIATPTRAIRTAIRTAICSAIPWAWHLLVAVIVKRHDLACVMLNSMRIVIALAPRPAWRLDLRGRLRATASLSPASLTPSSVMPSIVDDLLE